VADNINILVYVTSYQYMLLHTSKCCFPDIFALLKNISDERIVSSNHLFIFKKNAF